MCVTPAGTGGEARAEGRQGRQGGAGRARARRSLPARTRRTAATRLRLETQQGMATEYLIVTSMASSTTVQYKSSKKLLYVIF